MLSYFIFYNSRKHKFPFCQSKKRSWLTKCLANSYIYLNIYNPLETSKNLVYIYIYVYMYYLYYLIKKCPRGHCHNSFMVTGALGYTHVRLHVLGIQDPNKAQVNTRATKIIIHRNIHRHTHTHIYICTYIYVYSCGCKYIQAYR